MNKYNVEFTIHGLFEELVEASFEDEAIASVLERFPMLVTGDEEDTYYDNIFIHNIEEVNENDDD